MRKSENYYFLETIAVFGLRVALSMQLNELMKLSEYQRSRSNLGKSENYFFFWKLFQL